MFTLAISCLATSSLPWFMDLTFQIPVQYCYLQHWTLLSSPGTSTTGIVSTLSQPLQPFWSYFSCLVSYWAPTNLGSSSFSVVSFCLFILFMGFSRKECWSGLPLPSPVDHILSKLSSMTHPSWMALHCLAHSFIELDKALIHRICLVSFLWLWFSFCLPSEGWG